MKSGTQSLIWALVGTLAFFTIVKLNILEKTPLSKSFLRFLSDRTTEEITNDMCNKASSDLMEFYRENGPDYTFDPGEGSKLVNDIMYNFISNSSIQEIGTNEIKEYFSDSKGYIFILVLLILLVILWCPYSLCICCKCGCIPECCTKCPTIFIIGCLIFCALTLINCFIGYSENSSIVDGVYGLGCSFLKIERHLIDGDEYTKEKPYWVGINGVIEKLSDIISDISNIGEYAINISDSFNVKSSNIKADFNFSIENEWKAKKDYTLYNPYPNESNNMTPNLFLEQYGPINKKNSYLNIINQGMIYYINNASSIIEKVIGKIEDAKKNYASIEKNINETKKNLNNKINGVDEQIGDIIRNYDDKLDLIDSTSRTYMNLIFSLNLIIAVAVGVSLMLLLFCKCGSFILCISWSILYSFMLFTFFLGAVFGLIGSFMKDVSSGVNYLIKNIDTIESLDSQAKDIAQVCLNGNGSLAHSDLIPINFNLSMIDNVYDLNIDIKEEIGKIDYDEIGTKEFNQIYDQYLSENLNGAFLYTELKNSLNELNALTSNLDNSIDWEINSKNCKEGYEYTPYSLRDDSKTKKCFVITEWDETQFKNKYEDNPDIQEYYNSLNKFVSSNDIFIEGIKSKNNDFDEQFKLMTSAFNESIDEVSDLINDIRDKFNLIVGEKSIFEILNCKFLKRDVNKVVEVLYDSFGGTFKTTSTLFLMISAYELAITILILGIMKSFGNKEKSNDINFSKV